MIELRDYQLDAIERCRREVDVAGSG